MLPIILVSKSAESISEYVLETIHKENITSYNLVSIYPVKKEIIIDQIRDLNKELNYSLNARRLVVVYSFHTAGTEVQNSLLKTLEEKNEENLFILSVSSSEMLLPTILSRSKIVNLDEKKTDYEIDAKYLKVIKESLEKDNYYFLADESITKIDKNSADIFLENIILYFRKYLESQSSVEIIKKAIFLKRLLNSNNLNPQLTVDSMLFYIKNQTSNS